MDFYGEVSRNKRMTLLLFVAFFVLLGFLAYALSFVLDLFYGFGFTFVFAIFGILIILFSIISYYNSDKIVTSVSGAKPASENKYRMLHNIVEELCIASGLPKPKVYVMQDSAINAFAAGRDPKHAVICVTTGAVSRLKRSELQGVIAHELSHIQNYDVRTMTVATVLVGMVILISDMLFRMFFWGSIAGSRSRNSSGPIIVVVLAVAVLGAILAPIIASLIKFAVSRRAEFSADASAAKMTRNPEGLASALEIISKDGERLEAANKATAHLYISNPLKGRKMWMKSLFSTHPPLEERISLLRGK